MSETYKSRVYTDRPAYADFDAPQKFMAIQSIIAKWLREHPKAICSYSGGADSDILIDLIESTRAVFPQLPPVKYVFFNTGLEMQATKDHVKATAKKYGVEIKECRPKIGIVQAARTYGIPFMSKIASERISKWQKKNIPLSIAEEFERAEDKAKKKLELGERYPKCDTLINFICGCKNNGEPQTNRQLKLDGYAYMRDFINENPPDFTISAQCCDCCKKQVAHKVQKDFDMIITGERQAEGGVRSINFTSQMAYSNDESTKCFYENSDGQFRFRPLYFVTDADKAWYKERYNIRYSDAYEVYGLLRTGCCGCPINYKAVDDLEKIRPYEPNVVKAAWNIFGKSYEYRAKYNEYKEVRKQAEKANGQITLDDWENADAADKKGRQGE